MTIDRKISQDEVEQFYEDFSSEFVAPEERDVSFIVLSTDDIAAKSISATKISRLITTKTLTSLKHRKPAACCRWFSTVKKKQTKQMPH